MTVLPQRAEDIDAAWLQGALQASGVHCEALVAAVTCSPIGLDSGFASQIVRLHVRYAGTTPGALPASFVLKLPPADAFVRQLVLAFGFFPREVAVFRELAPRLPVRVPRCYFAAADEAGGGFLLLEDVHELPAAEQPAAGRRAEQAVELLSRLHACFWDDAALREGASFASRDLDARMAGAALLFEARIDVFRARCRGLPAELSRRLPDVGRFLARLGERARAPHCTLLHGDYRLENLLQPAEGGDPVLIDWQLASYGPGAHDLAYFLGQNLPSELRRVQHGSLLSRYHDALCRGGVIGYTREALERDYRRGLLAALMIPVNLSGTVLELERRAESADPATARAAQAMLPGVGALLERLSGRAVASVLEHDALVELPAS